MIVELRRYEKRLQSLGLMFMITRRLRGDVLEVFKIINGFDTIDPEHFLYIQNLI